MKIFNNSDAKRATKMSFILRVCIFPVLLLMAASGSVHAQFNDNSRALLNLLTSENGMHRITYAELAAQGADLNGLKHNKLGLMSDGVVIPIRTKGQDKAIGAPNRFGPGGYIEFYAEAPESLYSDTKAYTLTYLADRARMSVENAAFKANQAYVTDYTHSQTVEKDLYYDYLSPSKTDPWHFGQLISFVSNAKTTVNFELADVVGTTADLDINVYGIVDIKSDINDHHIVASLNGTEVGDQQFDGNVQSVLSIDDVPINNGANQFELSLRSIAGNPFDAVGLNKLTFRFQRNAVVPAGGVEQVQGLFAGPQALVSGFSSNDIAVYKKDVGNNITYLNNTHSGNGEAGFKINGGSGNYIVVGAANGYFTPTVATIADTQDIASGEAEYLIITHSAFNSAELATLVQLRSVDYSVKVVEVEQIYAQVGEHVPSADAIHNYIKFAAANLGTRFVTLVGSDTYDYKQIKSNSVSYIPTTYAETPGGQLFIRQTPSDASYGDLDGDGVPDIAVGRLSVRTNAELAAVIEKIQDYQAREGYAGRILIAADKEDIGNGIQFSDDVDAMIAAIPNEWQGSIRADYKAIPDVDGDAAARSKILNAINAGVSVAAYIGHSSQQQWSRATPPLFTSSDIANLTNIDKPTMVTQWGCWNTYFVDPSGNSMADQFLVGDNGAVTVLGASTLTTSEGERALGIELNKRMYLKGMPIGQAVVDAKQALALTDPEASDILLGWQIIGDPALVINP